jgi:hypothetical protein
MRMVYAILLLLFAPALTFADLKVTTKKTAGGRSTQSTIYIKGQRQRTDGAGVVTVYHYGRAETESAGRAGRGEARTREGET